MVRADDVCRVGLLLQLPAAIEQQFWTAPGTQSFLRFLDTVACSLPYLNLLMAGMRRIKDVSEQVHVPWGARLCLLVYLCINTTTLVLLWAFPRVYKQHRMSLIKLDRMWRLTTSALLTHPRSVLGYGTQTAAVGKAAVSGNISRALTITVFAPTAMHLQQANLHLPFKFLLPFQLGNFLIAVMWAQGLPCWLSATPSGHSHCTALFGADMLAANSSSGRASGGGTCSSMSDAALGAAAVLQKAAEQACGKIQLVHLLLVQTLPLAPAIASTPSHNVCLGPASFQVLYLYVAAVLLLVLPLTVCYTIEWWAKVWWLTSQGMAVQQQPWILTVFLPSAEPGTDSKPHFQLRHVLPLVVLLLVQLPWVIAEALASRMAGVCVPALYGTAFAWVEGVL